jgi:hypothetical protein
MGSISAGGIILEFDQATAAHDAIGDDRNNQGPVAYLICLQRKFSNSQALGQDALAMEDEASAKGETAATHVTSSTRESLQSEDQAFRLHRLRGTSKGAASESFCIPTVYFLPDS